VFKGSLGGFLDAVKAMEVRVVFFSALTLEEEHFKYVPKPDDDFNDPDYPEETDTIKDEESFDLTVALPTLAKFREHIGKEGMFHLIAKSPREMLNLYLTEAWWDEFGEQRSIAADKVDQNQEEVRERMEKQQAEREEQLFKQVRALLSDPEFCRIPTQRGMRAYALERFPDLKDVSAFRFTEEIQKLSDKIGGRKRK